MKYNLQENKVLMTRLLTEALVKSQADEFPGFEPDAKWTGPFAKYEEKLKKIGARPYPLPFATQAGKKAIWELQVGDDIMDFYENGTAYSTNQGIEFTYGVDPKYKGITIYDKSDKTNIKGAIELKNGKPTWTPVSAEDKTNTEESWVDYLQLALDVVGLIPGFGDIADIINAAISFGRENWLEGFLSLIGAIPVVGSAIAIPLKVALKGFRRAGDALALAWRGRKSADEVWLYIKNKGKLNRREMEMLVEGMGDVADYMNQFRKSAKWALPDSAYKALGEFADFMKRNADGADDILLKASDNAASTGKRGSILRVRKELNQLGGLKRFFGGGVFRRLRNTFTTALGPNELKALKSAMNLKFAKNMNNPAKLNVLLQTSPNQVKLLTNIGKDLGSYLNKLPKAEAEKIAKDWKQYEDWITWKPNFSPAKIRQTQLEYLKTNVPDVYNSTMNKIIRNAEDIKNPMYVQFMNNEVNALGTYFGSDYATSAIIATARDRWSNYVPVIYNEMSDIGEDALMAAGIETKDDINGLFYPALKSVINIGGYAGDMITPTVTAGVETVKSIPIIGATINTAADALGANAGKEYDPNVKFTIVPDEDPRLQQQKKEKQKRIQQNKSWF